MTLQAGARWCLAGYLALALLLTAVPIDLQKQGRRVAAAMRLIDRPTSMEQAGNQARTTDLAVNGLMLLPLGALAALGSRKWTAASGFLSCAAVSAVIEGTQGLVLGTRDAQLSDLLLNVAGGGVGACAIGVALAWANAKPPPQLRGR